MIGGEAGEPGADPADPARLSGRLAHACRGLSCRELAAFTGVSAETCRRYLRGDDPTAAFIARVCGGLGVSADWLLLGRGAPRYERGNAEAVRALEFLERRLADLRRQLEAMPAAPSDALGPPGAEIKPRGRTVRLVLGPAGGHALVCPDDPPWIAVAFDPSAGLARLIEDGSPCPPEIVLRYERLTAGTYRFVPPPGPAASDLRR